MEAKQAEAMPSANAQKVIAAQDAAVRQAEQSYRMASPDRPWAMGETFNHLYSAGAGDLSLCGDLRAGASARSAMLVARLHQVDCLGCLDAFTERTRPRG
ncbi:MAG: hypothetical protein ACJ72N_27600 [Labedaea sp.]